MTLPFEQTKDLVHLVLKWDSSLARSNLHSTLADMNSNEAEFYAGIIKHGPGLRLSSTQWFELLARLPNRLLRSQLPIDGILSLEQQRKLPPASG